MESQKKQKIKLSVIKYLMFVTSIILVVTFIMSIYYSSKISSMNKSSKYDKEQKMHYSALFIGNEMNFISGIKEGIENEAKRMNVDIEFHMVKDVEEATATINLLVRAGVDGIITQGINNEDFLVALKSVSEAKIPIVLMYTDLSTAERNAFVGINPFSMGGKASELVLNSHPKPGKIVFMTQASELVNENPASKMQILGFLDGLEGFYQPEDILLKQTQPTLLSAEGLASEIFINEKDVTTIVCTNETDTIGVAQVVVDLNRVGKTTIIGTGLTKEIIEYIEKGIVYGTLYRNPKQIGMKSMATLLKIPDSEAYTEISVDLITKENVAAYKTLIEGTP